MNCYEHYLRTLKPGDRVDLVNPMDMRRFGVVVSNDRQGLLVRVDEGLGHKVVRAFGRRSGTTRARSSFYHIVSPPRVS